MWFDDEAFTLTVVKPIVAATKDADIAATIYLAVYVFLSIYYNITFLNNLVLL